jgi:hypothetical protein
MMTLAQHFLLSAKARTLSIAAVLRMTDRQAETLFASLRWAETEGKAVCPNCDGPTCYECRRPEWRAALSLQGVPQGLLPHVRHLFAFHKLPLQTYLAAIVIFCNEVKGKSAWPSPATSACSTRRRSCWPTSCARRWPAR